MAEILPEPVDGEDIIVTPPAPQQPLKQQKIKKVKKTKSRNRNTFWFLIALVVIAVACLIIAFFYDYSRNKAQDNTRKQDISYISGVLNNYYEINQSYPTLDQINSSTFGAFSPNLDRSKFEAPDSNSVKLVAYPSASNYAYQPLPLGCNNVSVMCSGYKLIAVLNDGTEYYVSSDRSK